MKNIFSVINNTLLYIRLPQLYFCKIVFYAGFAGGVLHQGHHDRQGYAAHNGHGDHDGGGHDGQGDRGHDDQVGGGHGDHDGEVVCVRAPFPPHPHHQMHSLSSQQMNVWNWANKQCGLHTPLETSHKHGHQKQDEDYVALTVIIVINIVLSNIDTKTSAA